MRQPKTIHLYLSVGLFFISLCYANAQKTIAEALKKYNQESVPYIQIEALKDTDTAILLDARAKEEFDVSHLSGALWVGYENFKIATVLKQISDKTVPVVVYCSIGVRSEDIAEKLIAEGYTNVKNLYGGIFEWKNQGNPVYDTSNSSTEKVHAFSKQWGKLLTNADKVYKHP